MDRKLSKGIRRRLSEKDIGWAALTHCTQISWKITNRLSSHELTLWKSGPKRWVHFSVFCPPPSSWSYNSSLSSYKKLRPVCFFDVKARRTVCLGGSGLPVSSQPVETLLNMGYTPKGLLKSRGTNANIGHLLLVFPGLSSFLPSAFPHSYLPKEITLSFPPDSSGILTVDTIAIFTHLSISTWNF